MGNAIVLGHSGFLGRAVLRRLASHGVTAHGFSSAKIDLREAGSLAALDDVMGEDDVLWFLSALTPDKGNNLDAFSANVAMATNVARYLEGHRVRRVVYVSSDAVYPPLLEPVTEDARVEALNLYAAAKYASERALSCITEPKGIPLIVARVTGVFGPGDTHGSYGPNSFVRSLAKSGTVKLFGQGEELRDHIYVEDAARILVALAIGENHGIFNVATGVSRTFASIVQALGAIATFAVENAPRKAPVWHRRFDIARLRAALPDLELTPFDEALRLSLDAARASSL